jgi:pyruvate dehydrogenase E2 component (dihydrolipoamide acetyltransferase)
VAEQEPSRRQFRLPDTGEGLTEAEIVAWRVAPGDTVEVNDIVCEVETAKAIVELPSPYAGVVAELLVDPGRPVPVGHPIMSVDVGSAADSPSDAGEGRTAAPEEVSSPVVGAETPPVAGSGAVLVGYGTGRPDDMAGRRRRYARAMPPEGEPNHNGSPGGRPAAKPPVRRLARDLGVDLAALSGTGPGGRVTREDVLARIGGGAGAPAVPTAPWAAPAPVVPQPGDVRVPVRGVRKATAEAMVRSAFTAPHVTEWVQVDVTPTMEFVRRMREDKEFVGLRVSPLLVVAKAVCLAARRNPGVNATWDEAAREIVLRQRVHLGIAAATVRGLVVPVIHGADLMHMPRLAQELTDLVVTAREGRLQPGQMTGGTLTITNVGVFGVDGGTPILPPGQAAILTMGQIRQMPWVVDGTVVPRYVATLSVSFDHRLVDGELGSAFLTDVAAVLADPARGLIWA